MRGVVLCRAMTEESRKRSHEDEEEEEVVVTLGEIAEEIREQDELEREAEELLADHEDKCTHEEVRFCYGCIVY